MSSLIARFTSQPSIYYLPFVYTIGLIDNILNIIIFFSIKIAILTLINMRYISRRINPVMMITDGRNQFERLLKRKRELQFILLSFLQVLLYIILNSLRTFIQIIIYYVNVLRSPSSNERKIIFLLYYWGTYLLYTYAAITSILLNINSQISCKLFE
ncbi:hypothetical protein I4U23_016553 [Adineta vaga]|nr:hypothetical protein I4U23_016553 [Adineta vaga]